jgi:anthranilate phosphoribosyltransferase
MTGGETFIREVLNQVVAGEHLTREQARQVMDAFMEGKATPAQIGSLLTALRIKGETVDEITGFAETMREKAIRVEVKTDGVLLDTCGTGGDGKNTFNISTAAAIVAAAGGIRVAKHGNRAMSSKSGSADVLEELGIHIDLAPDEAQACLERVGLCFMFAQKYHLSMKHVAGPRRELGFRTVFNFLGPLTNPAGADHQLVGLFDRERTETIAHVLRELGTKRALVVASEDGLDEISISAPTRISELKDGVITTRTITPEELGLDRYPLSHVTGGDPRRSAEIIRRVFDGEQGARRNIVLANAGACFYVSGKSHTLEEGVQLAAQIIDSGLAREKLQELAGYTEAIGS